MRNILFFLFASSWFAISAQASPSEGFRAGFRLPVGTGTHSALVPAVGLGIETRLDLGDASLPLGFAFICSYDQFFSALPDQVAELPGGGVIVRPQAQSMSFSSFYGAATLRGRLGPLLAHADLGAGISIGFFHGVATERDPEVFTSEFLLSGMGGAGLSVLIGKQGVIDLTGRYQHMLLNDKTVLREGNDLLLFEDFFSIGLSAGYLF
jgi:hypothetical protein